MGLESHIQDGLKWAVDELTSSGSDLVVLCGSHAFRWYSKIKQLPKTENLTIIHPNALQYIPVDGRNISLLADETEFGRNLFETYCRFRSGSPKDFRILTIFLDACREASSRRSLSIDYLRTSGKDCERFAGALEQIKAYRQYDDCNSFHREAIVGLRNEMRYRSYAPLNADATLLRLTTTSRRNQNLIQSVLENVALSGWVYRPSDFCFTYVCSDFDPLICLYSSAADQWIPSCRGLLKLYEVNAAEVMAAPMVHARLRFDPDCGIPCFAQQEPKLQEMILSAQTAFVGNMDTTLRCLAYYDIVGFFLDLLLARKILVNSHNQWDVSLDRDSLDCYYGLELSSLLYPIAKLVLQPSELSAHRSGVAHPEQISNDTRCTDLGEVMLCKSAIYEEFVKCNAGIPDPILRRRAGLSFDELRAKTGLEDDRLTMCIDVLCELELTEPFNRLQRSESGHQFVSRCYNTTHGGVTSLMAHIVRLLKRRGISTQVTFLNKCLSFLTQVILPREEGFDVQRYHYGKMALVKIDDYDRIVGPTQFLDNNSTIFACNEDHQYIVREELPAESEALCSSISSGDQIDIYLEKFVELHEVARTLLSKKHLLVRDSQGCEQEVRESWCLAATIDMIGWRYPEAGFLTIGTNLARALEYQDSGERERCGEVLEKLLTKVRLLRVTEPILKAQVEFLRQKAGFVHTDRVLARFAYVPGGNPLWRLVEQCTVLARKRWTQGNLLGPSFRMLGSHLRSLGSEEGPEIKRLPLNEEVFRYVVSADMRKSKVLATEPLGNHWKQYCMQLMVAWMRWFDGEIINLTGDEGIIAFKSREQSAGFIGATWYHLNDVMAVLCPGHGFGFGLSSGRIVRNTISGKDSVVHGREAIFDPIAIACSLSKENTRIKESLHSGADPKELRPMDLFESCFAKPLREKLSS